VFIVNIDLLIADADLNNFPMRADLLVTHIRQLATPTGKTARAGKSQGKMHEVRDAAIVVRDGTIVYAGPAADAPRGPRARRTLDARGRIAIPALIDAHTHLPFMGGRRDEFLRRLRGETYLQIAQAGGGIVNSVRAVREATQGEITRTVAKRLKAYRDLGVLTVEAKSGYGLEFES